MSITTIFLVRRFRQPTVGIALFTNIKVTPVTNTGRIGTIAISADGKLFAFNQRPWARSRQEWFVLGTGEWRDEQSS